MKEWQMVLNIYTVLCVFVLYNKDDRKNESRLVRSIYENVFNLESIFQLTLFKI